jgi:hypothetical protein
VIGHFRLTRQQDLITALLGLSNLSLSGGFYFSDGAKLPIALFDRQQQ